MHPHQSVMPAPADLQRVSATNINTSPAVSSPTQSDYRLNALECTTFHPCGTLSDFQTPTTDRTFHPLYIHYFLADEQIHGWADCRIRIFYTTDTLDIYIDVDGVPNSTTVPTSNSSKCTADMGQPNAGETQIASVNITDDTQGCAASTHQPTNTQTTDHRQNKIKADAKAMLIAKFTATTFAFCTTAEEFIEKLTARSRENFLPVGVACRRLEAPRFTEIQQKQSRRNQQQHEGCCTTSYDPYLYPYRMKFYQHDEELHKYHRRIEWLLHFFIDACSSIEYDPRWDVMLYFAKRKVASTTSRLSTFVDREPTINPISTISPNVPPARNTRARRSRAPLSKVNHANAIMAEIIGTSPPHTDKTHTTEDSISSNSGSDTYFEFAAVATMYKFFALPLNRLRVSQFLVMPYLQGHGLGLTILESIHIQAVVDTTVMDLTVEDPANSFQQLRDVVSLKRAVAMCIIQADHLHPQLTPTHEKKFENELRKVYQALRTQSKESQNQAARVISILKFCSIIPNPLPPPPVLLFSRNSEISHMPTTVKCVRNGNVTTGENNDTSMKQQEQNSKCQDDKLNVTASVARDWRPVDESKFDDKAKSDANGIVNETIEVTSVAAKLTRKRRSPGRAGEQNTPTNLGQKSRSDAAGGMHTTGTNTTADNVSDDSVTFSSSEAMKPFRIEMKKKLRAECVEWLGALKQNHAREELEIQWKKMYASFYRTVKKLREIYPLQPRRLMNY